MANYIYEVIKYFKNVTMATQVNEEFEKNVEILSRHLYTIAILQ